MPKKQKLDLIDWLNIFPFVVLLDEVGQKEIMIAELYKSLARLKTT